MKLTKSKILSIVAAVLGLVAILLLLAPGVKQQVGPDKWEGTSGFKMAFGSEKGMKFSFVLFLPFLLAVIGIALSVVSLFVDNKILKIIAVAVFVIAGIFFFLYLSFYSTLAENDLAKEAIKEMIKAKYIKLGAGAIMAGIVSILAGASICVGTFVFKD